MTMDLSFNDKSTLNRHLLERLRLRLVDKETSVLDWPGITYVQDHPADRSLMGSIAQLPNPEFTGVQAPNAMGIVLLAKPDKSGCISMGIGGQFDVFFRLIPNVDLMMDNLLRNDEGVEANQTPVIVHRRITVTFEQVGITLNLPSQANQWQRSADSNPLTVAMDNLRQNLLDDPMIFRRLQSRSSGAPQTMFPWEDVIVDQESLNQAIANGLFENDNEVLEYRPVLRARARPAPPSLTEQVGFYLVEIFLENTTAQDEAGQFGIHKNAHFLDAQFWVELNAGESEGLPHRLEPADYRYKEHSTVPGYGVTTSVRKLNDLHFVTDAMPVSELEKIDNPSPQALGITSEPEFQLLQVDPLPILKQLITAVGRYGDEWQAQIDALRSSGETHEADVSERERDMLLQEQTNLADGINLLSEHPHLLQCFQWMNEVMGNAFKQQGKKHIKTWRLFQLGFILTQIRAIYERHCDDGELTDHLDIAEVLWFSTGGGKTEAYFGIIIMAMLYDRLKDRLYGPAAWMKFPLRMLSVQQFQRLAYVIAQANRIREREQEQLPGHPFTVGYFTGSGTPRNISSPYDNDAKTFLPSLDSTQLRQWRFINDCPYCDASESVSVERDLTNGRIKHVCSNDQCWSNTTASEGQHGEGMRGELGIYVSDEEVYRYCPTVMVGTIDKLATVAMNKRYRYFFGGGKYYCPQHGFSFEGRCVHYAFTQKSDGSYIAERCPNNTRTSAIRTLQLQPMRSPGISFILQDELHLLTENTGNFDAHYETLMSSLQESNGGRRPKVLSATATIKGYAHHIHHLYQRQARRFPVPGFMRGESFYSRIERDGDGVPLIRRMYAGILPLGAGTVMERAAAMASTRYLELIDDLRETSGHDQKGFAQSLGFHPDQGGALKTQLDDYLNTCLIYINSIRSASNVNRHLEEDQVPRHPEWRWRQLSGKTPLNEIQDTIHLVETKQPDNPTRQLIATSVVSHGVDMHRLNFMVFGGWPKSVAEYMQSSARAGRVEPGIVLTVIHSKNIFQSNVFLNFQDYHKFMDRMVETVPVNRFAPNLLERTLPGVISGCIVNWASGQSWGKAMMKNGGKIREALNTPGSGARALLQTEIIKALSVPDHLVANGHFDARVVAGFKAQLEREVEFAMSQMENMPRNLSEEPLFEVIGRLLGNRPMRNLRDIESQVMIKPRSNESKLLLEALARRD